jgi:hypothetical protein
METALKDVRFGFRMLVKSPGFTAVALLAITLGIAANTTTFSAMDATLFDPFAFPNQDRLVMLWETNPIWASNAAGSRGQRQRLARTESNPRTGRGHQPALRRSYRA